ncbi:MAG: asparagine synthase (glutamine-hydrolyzing) [Pseudomonadota bacterium]
MCGIAGAVSNQIDAQALRQQVQTMQDALRHRGPDDRGFATSPDYAASLAHTRLSVIDLSPTGHQPMQSGDERYTITYNGEIYNYKELREQLEQRGEHFTGSSDTEVILRLYQLEGADFLQRLRGMYALFIWDNKQHCGFAARDPLGIKPFYYWANKYSLAFASEIRALLKTELFDARLNPAGLSSYLTRGTCSEPDTLVEDIKQLPAGHTLLWENGQCTLNSFSNIDFTPSKMDHDAAIRLTRSALEDSVKAHFVADVPVGIFLSGGIDSTALLALARLVTDQTINTYSIAFEDPAWNEGDIAKRVAAHFDTNHTELVMTAAQAKSLFNDYLEAVDQPSIDGFNTYCVAKLAHEYGEKVVLSGLGGDEMFAGYKSFTLLPKMTRWSRWASKIGPLPGTVFTGLAKLSGSKYSGRLNRISDFLSDPGSLLAAHQSLRGIFSNREAEALCKKISGAQGINNSSEQTIGNSEMSIANQISELELSTYMRNQLLRDSDVMSMAWGLELRVPLVDFQLLQTIAPIPAEIRLQPGKRLLVESVPELPDWVVNRPKQGFRFPFDEWFNEEMESLPIHSQIPHWISLTPWYRRWAISVLEYWRTRYL